jgi:hypothetical protein
MYDVQNPVEFCSSGSHGTGQVLDYHIFWIIRQDLTGNDLLMPSENVHLQVTFISSY